MIRDAFKATDNIMRAMKESGHRSEEIWDHCRKKHLTVRKGVEIPAMVAYYVTTVVKGIEGLSGSFTSFLNVNLRSDSESLPTDTDNQTTATASTRRSSQQQKAFLGSFQQYAEKTLATFETFQNKSTETRQQLLELQTKQAKEVAASAEAERTRETWNEYDRLCQRVLDIAATRLSRNKVLLRNLCSRVQTLEVALGIDAENSVAVEAVRIMEGRNIDNDDEMN
jgi:hypothetical protein